MIRKIIIPILVLAILILGFFGSLMPIQKSNLYIRANSQSFKSVEDMKTRMERVISHPSPIGNEEVIKFFSSNLFNVVSSLENQEDAELLVRFIENNIVEDNFFHILNTGTLYNILWQEFDNEEYYQKAEEYYLKAHEMGPNVPQPLHSLYSIYRESNNSEKFEDIKNKLEDLWPEYQGLDSEGLDI